MGRKKRGKMFNYENGKMTEKSIVPSKTPTYTMSDISLVIPEKIYEKIMYWMSKANFEVSGFGSLDWEPETKTFTVRDAILLKQEVGSAMTEIDPVSLGKAMFRMKDEPNALKWHWHSHVDMGVFWSADDKELITQLGSQGWIMATVFNRKHEHLTAFFTRSKVLSYTHDCFFDELDTKIEKHTDATLAAEWDKEYDDNVKSKTYPNFMGLSDLGYMDGQQAFFNHEEHHEAHWSASQYSRKLEWDEAGYCKDSVHGWVYSPTKDKTLKSLEEKMSMIEEMDDKEIEFLRLRDQQFEKLVQRWIKAKASEKLTQAEREHLMSMEDNELKTGEYE
jgi:hypothetical protein